MTEFLAVFGAATLFFILGHIALQLYTKMIYNRFLIHPLGLEIAQLNADNAHLQKSLDLYIEELRIAQEEQEQITKQLLTRIQR